MSAISLSDTFERSTDVSYQVKVRAQTFLWGSENITTNVSFTRPVMLHVRNYIFGSIATIGTRDASGTVMSFGSIGPGECLSIEIQNIAGVVASCETGTETFVGCVFTT
jgi:hypothetical protein